MPKHWFFFSYARDQDGKNTPYQRQFFEDLEREIKTRFGLPQGFDRIGFLDTEIPTGEIWRDRLAEALNTCCAFVFLQEPNYFDREWCGKEWYVFRRRIDAYLEKQSNASRPSVMIPILWVPPEFKIPTFAAEIQHYHRDFGEVYAKEGLLDLMRARSDAQPEYWLFVKNLARTLYKVASDHSLPSLDNLPEFDEVPNVFQSPNYHAPRNVTQFIPRAPAAGPRWVQFVFVTARQDEIRESRRLLDAYGDEPDDWKPYFPDRDESAYRLAMSVAYSLDLKFETVDFAPDLIRKLEDARRARKVVVLVVDSWSLKLGLFQDVMVRFGDHNFWNSVVIVPWNEDEETREHIAELKGLLDSTFYSLRENANQPLVVAWEQFLPELAAAVTRRSGSLLRAPDTVFRPVSGNGLRSKPTVSSVRVF